MGAISKAVDWAGEHPITTAVGAFAVGAVVLFMLRGSGGGANSGMSAFYAAQAAQAASGNQLLAVENQTKAALGIAQVAASRDVSLATINGQTNTSLATINTAGAVNLATIGASRDVSLATIGSDTAKFTAQQQATAAIAAANAQAAAVAAQEQTRQMAQKQQYYLAVGQQAQEANALPYLIDLMRHGGPGAAAAEQSLALLSSGASTYHPAH